MDIDKLIEENKLCDDAFAKQQPDFVRWWSQHPHCDPDPKFAVRARVAHKCQCYRQEFLDAKEVGVA